MDKETRTFIEDGDHSWEVTAPGLSRKIMAYDPTVMMVKVAFEKGSIGALHSHPHVQVTYVDSGVFEAEISGKRKILKAGDVFYVPPHAIHGVVCLETGMLIDVFSPMREDFIKQ